MSATSGWTIAPQVDGAHPVPVQVAAIGEIDAKPATANMDFKWEDAAGWKNTSDKAGMLIACRTYFYVPPEWYKLADYAIASGYVYLELGDKTADTVFGKGMVDPTFVFEGTYLPWSLRLDEWLKDVVLSSASLVTRRVDNVNFSRAVQHFVGRLYDSISPRAYLDFSIGFVTDSGDVGKALREFVFDIKVGVIFNKITLNVNVWELFYVDERGARAHMRRESRRQRKAEKLALGFAALPFCYETDADRKSVV